MTGILAKLSGDIRTRNVRTDLRLEFIRFRKFLENMREIIGLIEDAKDKLREEYIFDRHYVLSLVDGVLEKAAMLAFNASVLSPVSGEEIYLRLDGHKGFAQEEFLKSRGIRTERFSIPSSYLDADAEAQWLSAVLNWLTGPLPDGQPAVMDFIGYVVDEVIGHCRKEALIKKAGASVGKLKLNERTFLKTVDMEGISSRRSRQSVSQQDIKCRPFGLLLLGLLDGAVPGGIPGGESGIDRWMLFDENEISLRISRKNIKIHLEAALYGNIASDFIFLYCRNPFDFKSVFPPGSWVGKTGQGALAWIYDAPIDHLEKQLVQLGSALLG